jgi:hypothetical protein
LLVSHDGILDESPGTHDSRRWKIIAGSLIPCPRLFGFVTDHGGDFHAAGKIPIRLNMLYALLQGVTHTGAASAASGQDGPFLHINEVSEAMAQMADPIQARTRGFRARMIDGLRVVCRARYLMTPNAFQR